MDRMAFGIARAQRGFAPAVDVFYEGDPPQAVVVVDLAGVEADQVGLEVRGRELLITGFRRPGAVEGRVYQQLEIPNGPFRRVVSLGADVQADAARARYDDGLLRVTLPLVLPEPRSQSVRIETSRP
jgi:HSP20 family protein